MIILFYLRQIGKKKKRRRTVEGDTVVLGTASGSLLFYGVTKAQLLSHQKDAHSGKVTGVSWSNKTLNLYSCGEDGYILEWEPEATKFIRYNNFTFRNK